MKKRGENMEVLGSYKNGNYNVKIFKDGTKIRFNNLDNLTPEKPESMDLKITNKCDMGCKFCLKPSVKLNIEESTKEISNIRLGDKVLSMNIETNELQLKPVVKLYERDYEGELISIETTTGNVLTCTPNHKVYTVNRGYIRADELTENDVLVLN